MKKALVILMLAGFLSLAGCSSGSGGNSPQGQAAAGQEIGTTAQEPAPSGDQEDTPEGEDGQGEAMEQGIGDIMEDTIGGDSTASEGDISLDDALEQLDAIQQNYAQGTAPLNIIPVPLVQAVYDNYDAIEADPPANAPISLREYAATDEVFFDYSTDYSIKWEKQTGNITVEQTDVQEREDFKQKAHKQYR